MRQTRAQTRMMCMRIGITGATGFIGGHLAVGAKSHGHEVVAYSRGQRQVSHAAETLRQPAEAPHALPETRLDALVHLSGESLMGLWTAEKRKRIWQSRVDFTEALVAHLANLLLRKSCKGLRLPKKKTSLLVVLVKCSCCPQQCPLMRKTSQQCLPRFCCS